MRQRKVLDVVSTFTDTVPYRSRARWTSTHFLAPRPERHLDETLELDEFGCADDDEEIAGLEPPPSPLPGG